MLVDSRRRAAYLPRSIFLKSERLYEGRIQSLSSDLLFFINFSLLFQSLAPVVWLAPMMLNRNDDNYAALGFVNDAVRKSMDLAAARALRQRRPGFRIISDTLYGLFDFVRKLES